MASRDGEGQPMRVSGIARIWALTAALLAAVVGVAPVPQAAAADPTCQGRIVTLPGTEGPDILVGTAGDDVIHGLGGDDTIRGRGGNDVICGGPGADTLDGGPGADILLPGAGVDTLIGAGGPDTLYGEANTISLAGGPGDDVFVLSGPTGAIAGGLGADWVDYSPAGAGQVIDLRSFAGVENAVGSEFDDTITGTGGRNTLHGGSGLDEVDALGGNDLVDGGLGQDILDGGSGRDTLSMARQAADGVKVDLGQGKAWDHPSLPYYYKTVSNFENIAGSGGHDLLIGDARPNVIDGGEGNDTLQGAGGADVLLGGPGVDRVSFQAAPRGVSVDLGAGMAVGDGADVFAEVEGAWGSRYDDTIVGDDGPNYLSGDEGEDILIGLGGNDELLGGDAPDFLDGGPGNDTLNGMQAGDYLLGGPGDDMINGAGAKTVDTAEMRDVASFEESTQPVVVQFGDSSSDATATGEGTDRLTDIAIVVGTPFADRMRARGNSAVLVGLEGNDTLTGNYLVGGPGDDRLDGFAAGSEWDSGYETADFSDAPGPMEVDLGAGRATGEGDDTLIGITRAVGGEFDDRLTGCPGGNRLYGLGGDDRLYGLDGNDWLWGDLGSDYLSGGPGTDRCVDGESLSSCEYTYTTEGHGAPGPAPRMAWGRAPAWSEWVAPPVSRLLWGEPAARPSLPGPAAR